MKQFFDAFGLVENHVRLLLFWHLLNYIVTTYTSLFCEKERKNYEKDIEEHEGGFSRRFFMSGKEVFYQQMACESLAEKYKAAEPAMWDAKGGWVVWEILERWFLKSGALCVV